ncbi:histidine acid phosphatase [Emericellopsis atlantica]|uniref:3-phytase n=1 Tax=Emericellopsis atlantica TaxID=2614577 RepID=A0A9P7ZKS2_9HYPO|nr:histidine acid phosphatase [Emericellopsis atlantica]KAG9253943.1 histidine acid phosphatase [Emericellopsis atlantica]
MTTLQPRAPYTDAELAALYPPSLQLQNVQILLRHGERTPVTPRFQEHGLPAFWPYCKAVRHLRSAVMDVDPDAPADAQFSTLAWKRRLETMGHKDAPVIAAGKQGELDDICDMGMLTDKGRATTTHLGRRLRALYVDRLGFLAPSLDADNVDTLYLRATPIQRALESMQQTLHGLYPPATRAPGLPPVNVLARAIGDETLFPNEGNCRRFAVLARAFAQRAAERWNDSPEMDYLTRQLGRYLPDPSARVAVDGKPRLSGIMDTMNATYAHGPDTKLPKAFYDPKVKDIIETIGVEEWYAGYRESEEYRTLGIGGLLGDVVARMVGSVEQTTADGQYELQRRGQGHAPAVRFGLSGCHDTTLAAILSSLGTFGHKQWPPFTSHVAIELFRHTTTPDKPPPAAPTTGSWLASLFGASGKATLSPPGVPPAGGIGRTKMSDLTPAERERLEGYYVRVRYNDEPVTIPGCKQQGNHLEGDESFCTLAAFKSIVDKFTPVDWRQQCRTNINATPFPETKQPSGF